MFPYRFKYDVICSHGSNCNDGSTSSWIIWRTLPQSYKDLLARECGFYATPSDSESEEQKNTGKFIHPNSPKGALNLQDRGFPLVFVFIGQTEPIPTRLFQNKRVLILDLDLGAQLPEIVKASSFTLLID